MEKQIASKRKQEIGIFQAQGYFNEATGNKSAQRALREKSLERKTFSSPDENTASCVACVRVRPLCLKNQRDVDLTRNYLHCH